MQKEYYKLKDINEDIWAYKSKLRSLDPKSEMFRTYQDFLSGLKLRKKVLIKKNAGNASFFHSGIPPHLPKLSKKQIALNSIDKQIRQLKLRHEQELSDLYRARDEVRNS